MTRTPPRTYSKNRDVVCGMTHEGFVVYNPASGEFHSFNETAEKIWTLLDRQLDLDQIAKQVASQFAIDLEMATRDVGGFIDSLREKDLLRQDEERGPGTVSGK